MSLEKFLQGVFDVPQRINYTTPGERLNNLIIQDLGRIRQENFSSEQDTSDDDHTIVVHVGYDTKPEDINVELSPDKKTVSVEVSKQSDNGSRHYMKQTYSNSRGFDYENMDLELSDGDLILYAPFQNLEHKEEPRRLTIKHDPELAESHNDKHCEDCEHPENCDDSKDCDKTNTETEQKEDTK